MCPDRSPSRTRHRYDLWSTWGEAAFGALAVAVVSGVALAVPYDVQKPYDSLSWMLLANPAGVFFRNLHYWTAQVFLVLTLAHVVDHLARGTEVRVPRAVWRRLALAWPLGGFLLLSGFMLKGDPEAQQALRIVAAVLERLPLVGPLLSIALLGAAANRQILYVHHVATASLLVWLLVAEHAKTAWPRLVSTLEVLVIGAGASLMLAPLLHDGLDPIVKGPWYFLGLQEILHWTSNPLVVMACAVALLGLLVLLPRLADRQARLAKAALGVAVAGYGALTLVGVFARGENWTLRVAWPRPSGIVAERWARWRPPSLETLSAHPPPVVLGRLEGCLVCHAGVRGLSASHSAQAVGCAACHGGNPFSLDRDGAHDGLIRIPGNLADATRTCGAPACHPSAVERVPRSLMASMAGIIAVDRAVFGERASPDHPPHVGALGRTGADAHLRQLCASCHLGATKTAFGPIDDMSRGGGCTACHLGYSRDATADLARYERDQHLGRAPVSPSTHPNLSVAIGRSQCFGCHSRSGRISMSYDGWHEAGLSGPAPADTAPHRALADGRLLVMVAADVHAAQGMDCIDCHTSTEVMGDGLSHARKSEALKVTCEDCHVPGGAVAGRVVAFEALGAEARRLAALRGRAHAGQRWLATGRDGEPLLNTVVDGTAAWLVTKNGGRRLPLKPPAPVCLEGGGHARLSCVSCHGAWAPRCPDCHTTFEPGGRAVDLVDGRSVAGAWVEREGPFTAVPPTLGVRTALGSAERGGVVDPFIPGMVLTIDGATTALGRTGSVFRRLYARAFSHTVSRQPRSCVSCHTDPGALGYGEGDLRYERGGAKGHWVFTPRHMPGPDGLPSDGWTGFLQERTAGASTREDVRPFLIGEQERILTAGACLTCHEPTSRAMRGAVTDFRGTLARVSTRCVLPRFN